MPGPRSRRVPEIETPATHDERPRRRFRRRQGSVEEPSRKAGAWHPRWYWPSFVAPGSLWLALLFVLPFYVVFSVAFGTVDFESFGAPVPYYAPWWWSFDTFNETLSKFYEGTAIYRPPLFRTFVYVFSATVICLVVGLHGRLLRGTRRDEVQGPDPDPARLTAVDQLPDADLRVAGPSGGRRTDQPPAQPARFRRHELAAGHARHRDPGPRLRVHPVHDPAHLRLARPHPGEFARGRARPRRQRSADVLAGHAPTVTTRDPGRHRDRHAADVRRLLHERPARIDEDLDVRQPDRRATIPERRDRRGWRHSC